MSTSWRGIYHSPSINGEQTLVNYLWAKSFADMTASSCSIDIYPVIPQLDETVNQAPISQIERTNICQSRAMQCSHSMNIDLQTRDNNTMIFFRLFHQLEPFARIEVLICSSAEIFHSPALPDLYSSLSCPPYQALPSIMHIAYPETVQRAGMACSLPSYPT